MSAFPHQKPSTFERVARIERSPVEMIDYLSPLTGRPFPSRNSILVLDGIAGLSQCFCQSQMIWHRQSPIDSRNSCAVAMVIIGNPIARVGRWSVNFGGSVDWINDCDQRIYEMFLIA